MTEQQATEAARRSRSAAMATLGLLLFVGGGLLAVYGTGTGPGALIFGLLGAALIVAALVIRR